MGTSNLTSDSTLDPPSPGDDQSLLQRYRRGDDDAATELYMRYAHRLQALAQAQTSTDLKQRVDNDDLVQSIFRTFFRRVASGQYDVPNSEEPWKLLLVIGLSARLLPSFCGQRIRHPSRVDSQSRPRVKQSY